MLKWDYLENKDLLTLIIIMDDIETCAHWKTFVEEILLHIFDSQISEFDTFVLHEPHEHADGHFGS